jgi:hypothetical protein
MTQRITPSPANLTDEDIQELLPWYATGKTTPEETAAIEQRLTQSADLQAELALARREHAVAREEAARLWEPLGEPSPAVLDRLMAQIDGARQLPPLAGAGDEREKTGLAGFLSRAFGFMPSPVLRAALVAACLVIVVEGAAIWRLQTESAGGTYQTASAPEPANAGPQLIVQFQPNAGIAAISSILGEIDAGVVKGPMPDGAYVIGLPVGADTGAAMARLRGHPDLVAGVDPGS